MLYLNKNTLNKYIVMKNLRQFSCKEQMMVDKIANGRLKKWITEQCLLTQDYVKDPTKTINQVISEVIAQTKENIVVKRFIRYELGEV